MSNHNSQRSIILHHEQVNAGKLRRQQKYVEWQMGYLMRKAEHWLDYQCVMAFEFICFCYMMIATAVYCGYVLS